MDGSIVIARWRQCALPGSHEGTLAQSGEYDWACASFGPPESTTQTANRSVQPFLHSLWQKVPILCNGRPFPPKLPLPMGIWHHPTRFLGPIRAYNPNGISIGSAIFAQMTAECPDTLQWDAPFASQNCAFPLGIQTPSNTWFPEPTQVLNPNGISVGSADSLV